MQVSDFEENSFLKKITEIIENNISNEKFGVSELANEIGMSRSNLLRKIQKTTNLSVSQFIRQIRLHYAMDLIKQGTFNVSEVAYKVGFSSTSYFIKCFREYYGYPPGEVGKQDKTETPKPKTKKKSIFIFTGIALVMIFILFLVLFITNTKEPIKEKSIAVLPFKNDSNDSANIYVVNGLMEAILNNLQKIEDLKVISRTSVEKYRNTNKTIPEIAKELNVSYFVEGSGQKIDDNILLNIQLIEATSDKHLWAEQYSKKTKDIFNLQKEVAKNIAKEIEVIITPDEAKRIDKIPTNNLEAYDFYLQGVELMHNETREGVKEGISLLKKAIELDNEFALAHAVIAMAYYYLDIFIKDKTHADSINYYADKALLIDSQQSVALAAKALYYYNVGEYTQAEPYLKKALEYNPNSAMILNLLSDFYTSIAPNTSKYLEYALKGVQIDIASNDSSDASFIYLHVSNSLIQCGFIDEALLYADKSLSYNPHNIYTEYVTAYILYAKEKKLKKTRDRLIGTYNKDTTRIDVIQEVANICYYMRDYSESFKYYKKLVSIRDAQNFDLYRHKNLQIGFVFEKMGFTQEANKLFDDFLDYTENENSIYKHANLALYYAYKNDIDKTFYHLNLFSQEDNFYYWIVLFFNKEPLFDNIKDNEDFIQIMNVIEDKFWKNQNKIKESLQSKGLI